MCDLPFPARLYFNFHIFKIDFAKLELLTRGLKFIFQIIAAKLIVDSGLIIDNLHGVIGIYELGRLASQLLTIFIIVAIINSINFIDGIDGLALSVIIVFVLSFLDPKPTQPD